MVQTCFEYVFIEWSSWEVISRRLLLTHVHLDPSNLVLSAYMCSCVIKKWICCVHHNIVVFKLSFQNINIVMYYDTNLKTIFNYKSSTICLHLAHTWLELNINIYIYIYTLLCTSFVLYLQLVYTISTLYLQLAYTLDTSHCIYRLFETVYMLVSSCLFATLISLMYFILHVHLLQTRRLYFVLLATMLRSLIQYNTW